MMINENSDIGEKIGLKKQIELMYKEGRQISWDDQTGMFREAIVESMVV